MTPAEKADWFEQQGWDVMRGLGRHDPLCGDGFEADLGFAGVRYTSSSSSWEVKTSWDGLADIENATKIRDGISAALAMIEELGKVLAIEESLQKGWEDRCKAEIASGFTQARSDIRYRGV